MTEEEKKAIEEIKKFKFTESEKVAEENGLEHAEFARFLTIYHRKQLNILLNLIEKLQKEKEMYRNDIYGTRLVLKERDKEIEELKANSILKDKIREKLEKIEKEKEQYYAAGQPLMYMLLKNQLKSLIEEE